MPRLYVATFSQLPELSHTIYNTSAVSWLHISHHWTMNQVCFLYDTCQDISVGVCFVIVIFIGCVSNGC